MPLARRTLSALTPTEAGHLRTIIEELSRPEARDPKLAARDVFPHRASHRGQDLAGARLHHFQPVLRHGAVGCCRTGEGSPR